MEHVFFDRSSRFPPFMAYPRFLLDCNLSETAKLVYVLLLDRAKLSGKNEGWTDEQGRVFLFFTIEGIAQTIHKSAMTVKKALSALDRAGWITRKRQGIGRPSRIYVMLPPAMAQNLSTRQTENLLSNGQLSICHMEEKLSTNQRTEQNKTNTSEGSNDKRTAYGIYRNVFLSNDELAALRVEMPNLEHSIEKLSCYMYANGKQYQDHAATLRMWALRDKPVQSTRTYECEEDESL